MTQISSPARRASESSTNSSQMSLELKVNVGEAQNSNPKSNTSNPSTLLNSTHQINQINRILNGNHLASSCLDPTSPGGSFSGTLPIFSELTLEPIPESFKKGFSKNPAPPVCLVDPYDKNLFDRPHPYLTPAASPKTSQSTPSGHYIHQKCPSFLDDDDEDNFGKPDSKKLIETVPVLVPKIPPLVSLYNARPNPPSSSQLFVIKFQDILWTTSTKDIQKFLSCIDIPLGHVPPYFTHGIHIIISPSSKENMAFVEVPTMELANKALATKKSLLAGRKVKMSLSSQEELLVALFPRHVIKKDGNEIELGAVFVSRDQVARLLSICRSARSVEIDSPGYRKVERAFDLICSYLSKVPWNEAESISTLHRDHLFELTKLSLDAIIYSGEKSVFYAGIIKKVLYAGLCVPLFTEKQKVMLLTSVEMECPVAYKDFVFMPEDYANSTKQIRAVPNDTKEEAPNKSDVDTIVPDPLDQATIISHLQHRLERADRLISAIRQEQHESFVKYQDTLYDLQDANERFETLLEAHERLKIAVRRSRRPVQLIDSAPTTPTTPTPITTASFTPAHDFTKHWIQSQGTKM